MRKTFRFTLSENEHHDIIKVIERCPRVLRNELIVLAMKTLLENKLDLMISKSVKTNELAKEKTSEEVKRLDTIDITNIFK